MGRRLVECFGRQLGIGERGEVEGWGGRGAAWDWAGWEGRRGREWGVGGR